MAMARKDVVREDSSRTAALSNEAPQPTAPPQELYQAEPLPFGRGAVYQSRALPVPAPKLLPPASQLAVVGEWPEEPLVEVLAPVEYVELPVMEDDSVEAAGEEEAEASASGDAPTSTGASTETPPADPTGDPAGDGIDDDHGVPDGHDGDGDAPG